MKAIEQSQIFWTTLNYAAAFTKFIVNDLSDMKQIEICDGPDSQEKDMYYSKVSLLTWVDLSYVLFL